MYSISTCKYKAFCFYSPGIAAVSPDSYCLCHKRLSKASRLDNKETDSKPVKFEHRSCMYNQCCHGLVSF